MYGHKLSLHIFFGLTGILAIAAVSAEGHVNTNIGNTIDAVKRIMTIQAGQYKSMYGQSPYEDNSMTARTTPPDQMSFSNSGQNNANGNFPTDVNFGEMNPKEDDFRNYLDQYGVSNGGVGPTSEFESVLAKLETTKIYMGCPWALVMTGNYFNKSVFVVSSLTESWANTYM